MDSDIKSFLMIAIVAIIILVIFSYIKAKSRNKAYIVFANNTEFKTNSGSVYAISDLKKINYLNKYIIGKGTQTATVGLNFYFKNGIANIDTRSNIYNDVLNFANKLEIEKKAIIVKGLIKEVNNI